MKAKDFVQEKYTAAHCERHRTRGCFGKNYYIIWSSYSRDKIRLSDADTIGKAWTEAKKYIIEQSENINK